MKNDINKKDENVKEPVDENSSLNLKRERYMNTLNLDAKASMKNRVLVGIMLVITVVPCVIIGDFVFALLVLVASLISCHEIINTPQSLEKRFNWLLYVFAYVMMASLVYWIMFKNNIQFAIDNPDSFTFDLSRGFLGPRISLAAFFICVAFFFFAALFDKKFTMNDAFYFIGMLLIVSVGFQSILFLRYAPFTYNYLVPSVDVTTPGFKYGQSMLLMFFMLLGTCLNDVGAYFIGVLFGKHKMCPRISPKKTWEGFIGGIVISIASTLIFGLTLDACGLPLLPGVLDVDHWYNVLILSIIIPVFGVFGDFIFSAIKRSYNIKDFGKALKSHGGILDRLDSLLIVSIAMSLFIEVMANNWSIFSVNV